MSLPKEKREWLVEKYGEERIAALEADVDQKAKDAEGLEFKEEETDENERKCTGCTTCATICPDVAIEVYRG